MKALSASFAALLLSVLLLRGANGATETVVYSFCSQYKQHQCMDGDFPDAGLINVKGTLYGSTVRGGAYGYGTVFSFDPTSGAETALYSFCSQKHCTDGEGPYASLINVGGTLYGTTVYGGVYSDCTCGTVFSLDPATGAETVLHSFGSGTDGTYPDDSVIDVEGALYGTTAEGGAGICYGQFTCGTAFALDLATGAETVLYSFCIQNTCPNGAYPHAGLINIKGALYGTTESGGAYNGGTVFALDPATGVETVLHSFGSGADGNGPFGGRLINVKGALYGSTVGGGAYGDGTVFSINPATGAETTVYSFCSRKNCTDGDGPLGSLTNVEGKLYGTTKAGGAHGAKYGGFGTAFSLDPQTGAETVLHSFDYDGTDGYYPEAGLINVKGTLYGTTYGGGAHGEGTVFSITP